MHVQVWLDNQFYLPTGLNDLRQAVFGFQTQSSLGLTLCAEGLRSVETDEAVAVITVVDGVTINGNHLGCAQGYCLF
ncbi:hypothetical protein FIU92_21265 (plasmid) [Ruegeria sp. THAF33]|nr:hypothetical protein FIU92_21265 [Ruegeria sp. THAF33]